MSVADPRRQRQLQQLVQRLGLTETPVLRWDLLDRALTHPSCSTEANYEQLEFVGDAVIRLVAAELLWQATGEGLVGEWSAVRAMVVSDRSLARLAESYGLDRFLLVGGSATTDYRGVESRLADAFEALLAALYLSTHNLTLIKPWLEPQLQRLVAEVRADPAYQNYKAALQVWTQAHHQTLPTYQVKEVNPQGSSDRFLAEVWVNQQCLGQGSGRSIKAAEKAAAQVAFLKLQAG